MEVADRTSISHFFIKYGMITEVLFRYNGQLKKRRILKRQSKYFIKLDSVRKMRFPNASPNRKKEAVIQGFHIITAS